ncbi:alanine racemase [Glaciibacter flavus]|uniref:alanine racemase n=1 Tax=Orlajensenia flava TaxID=2565934 RepID=UPI003AFFDF54
MTGPPLFREAFVDLAAIEQNMRAIRAVVGTPHTMAVVKANAYGHGAVPVARAALAGGADWLGVAEIAEAMELRGAGITAPILAWLHDPDTDFTEAVSSGVTIGVSSLDQLEAAAAAAGDRIVADVHLKFDTGLSRNGIPRSEWRAVLDRAASLQEDRRVRVTGLFSHLSGASPEEDSVQRTAFETAVEAAHTVGIRPDLLHLASTSAAITQPDSRFSLVRIGIGMYGLSPWTGTDAGANLRPAMTLRGRVAHLRRVQPGTGASYDLTWRAERETTLALVPLGYAEGIPRQASGSAEVSIGGVRHPVVGRVAMDQFIVDLGDTPVGIGDTVVVFGDPATGAPSADDWALAAGTINYEIVTRIGNRVPRTYGAA